MKKSYIKPTAKVFEIDTEGIISTSPGIIVLDGNITEGDGSDGLSTTYRSNLWE